MDAGKLGERVTFQRATATEDDHGGETLVWSELQQAWASVRYGTAQERRQAAQEQSEQSATFEVRTTTLLRSVTSKDRILMHSNGSEWDVQGQGDPLDRQTLRFTAVRAV